MGFGGISLWQILIISCFVLLYLLVRKTFKKSHKKETPQISDATFKSPQTTEALQTPQAPETQEVPEVPEVPETPQSFAAPPNTPTTNPGDTGALKGWVYVATIENTRSARRGLTGVVKIGYSERRPPAENRRKDYVVYAALVEEPQEYESRVHQRLSEFRTRGEWFKCDLDTVITAIQESGTVLYAEDRRS